MPDHYYVESIHIDGVVIEMTVNSIVTLELALTQTSPDPVALYSIQGLDKRFADGLAIHRNNVQFVRVSALRQTFPIVEKLLGVDYFGALAVAFIAKHSPQSAVLHEFGSELPSFIEDFPPLAQWGYLADIARLEWARLCAFHAADEAPVQFFEDDLISELELMFAQTLRWHPSVSLVRSSHPILSIFSSQEHQSKPPTTEQWLGENVLIWREGFRIRTEPVDDLACNFLTEVASGLRIENIVFAVNGNQNVIVDKLATFLKWKIFCFGVQAEKRVLSEGDCCVQF